jgi:hypothetical protein
MRRITTPLCHAATGYLRDWCAAAFSRPSRHENDRFSSPKKLLAAVSNFERISTFLQSKISKITWNHSIGYLSLVFLPPYSPELNPIERLWQHLHDNRLSHCVFQTTEAIIDTCCEAWNWLLAKTGRIRSLCSCPWLKQVSN